MLSTSPSEGDGTGIFSDLFRPLPVFFFVTLITGPVYGIPNFQEVMAAVTEFSYNSITVFLHLLLPPATGLLAALGVYLGRTERFPGSGSSAEGLTGGFFRTDDRVRAVLRSVPLAIVTISPEREITMKNPSAQDMFGPVQDNGRDPLLDFIEDSGLQSAVDRIFEGNSITLEELSFRTGDGDGAHFLKVNGIPVLKNEKVVEALLIIEDVTDWKILQENLMRSEEQYRNIFNHAHCAIFFVDRNGNYLDANPAALKMLGYTRDELLTLKTREISSDSDRRIEQLESSPGQMVEETRYLRKDGKIVEAELAGTSFRSGDETYFIGIVKDLTRRKQIELLISTILGETENALLIFDSEGRVENASRGARTLFRETVDGLKGQTLEDLAPGCGISAGELSSEKSVEVTLKGSEGLNVHLTRLRTETEFDGAVVLVEPGVSSQ